MPFFHRDREKKRESDSDVDEIKNTVLFHQNLVKLRISPQNSKNSVILIDINFVR